MTPKELMAKLVDLGAAKWEADREAHRKGVPPPDMHVFTYKYFLAE